MNEQHTQACYQRLADRINSHVPRGENYEITIDARDLYQVLKALEWAGFDELDRDRTQLPKKVAEFMMARKKQHENEMAAKFPHLKTK